MTVSSEDVKKRVDQLLQGFDVSYIEFLNGWHAEWEIFSSPEKG